MAQRVGVEAIVDLTNFNRGVGIYLTGIDRMWLGSNKAIAAIAADFNLLGKVTSAVIASAAIGLGGAAFNVLKTYGQFTADTVQDSAELEQQIANIAAALGMAVEEAAAFKEEAISLGIDPRLKVTTLEAADAMLMLAKNGLTTTQIIDGAARASIALANAVGGEFELAADVVTDVMAIFKVEATDTERIIDQITGTINNSKFDLNDYFLALANSGAIFSTVGGNFEDMNTAITLVANAFNTGRRAGTGFSQFIVRMPGITKKARDWMVHLGIVSEDTAHNALLMGEGTAQQLATLEDAYYNIRQQIRDYQSTTVGASLTEEQRANAIAMLEAQATSLEEQLDPLYKEMEKLASQTSKLGNRFFDAEGNFLGMENAAQVLKETMSGLSDVERSLAIKDIFGVDAQEVVVRLLEEGAEGWRKFEDKVKSVSGFDSAATRMQTLSGSIEILMGQLEAFSIGIGDLFNKSSKKFVDALAELFAANDKKIVAAWEPVAKVFNEFVDQLIPIVKEYFPDFISLLERLNRAVASVFKRIGDLVLAMLPKLIDTLNGVFEWLEKLIVSGDFFNESFGLLPKFIQRVITAFFDFLDIARSTWRFFNDFYRGIKDILKPLDSWFGRTVTMVDVFLALGAAVALSMMPLVALAGRMVLLTTVTAAVIASIRKNFMGELQAVLKFGVDLIYDFVQTFTDVTQLLLKGDFSGAWEEILGFGSRTWEKIIPIVRAIIQRVREIILRIDWGAIWSGLIRTLVRFGRDVVNYIANEIDWHWVWSKVSESAIAAFTWTINWLKENIDWAGIWEGVVASVVYIMDLVVAYIKNIDWEGVWAFVWGYARKYALIAWDAIVTYIRNIDWAGIWSQIRDYARAAWDWLYDYSRRIVLRAWSEIQAFVARLWTQVSDYVRQINWQQVWSNFKRFVQQGISDIRTFLLNLDWDSVFDRIGAAGTDIRQFVIGVVNDILRFLADDVDWRKSTYNILKAIFSGLEQTVGEFDWSALVRLVINFVRGVVLGTFDVLREIDWPSLWSRLVVGLESAWAMVKAEISSWDWETVWSNAMRLGSLARDVSSSVLSLLTEVLNNVLRFMAYDVDWKNVFSSILGGAETGLISVIGKIDWTAAGTAIKSIILGFIGAVSEVVSEIDWPSVWERVKEISLSAWEFIVELISMVNWERVWAVIREGAFFLWQFIQDRALWAWNWIIEYVKGLDWETIWSTIREYAALGWDFVREKAEWAWGEIVSIISAINWEEVWGNIKTAFGTAWEGIVSFFTEEGQGGWRIVNWFSTEFPLATEQAKIAWQGITDKFTELQAIWSETLTKAGTDWETWRSRIDEVLSTLVVLAGESVKLIIAALEEILLFLQGDSEQQWVIWAGIAVMSLGFIKGALVTLAAVSTGSWLIIAGAAILGIGLIGDEILKLIEKPLTDLTAWFAEHLPSTLLGFVKTFTVVAEIWEYLVNRMGEKGIVFSEVVAFVDRAVGAAATTVGVLGKLVLAVLKAMDLLDNSLSRWNFGLDPDVAEKYGISVPKPDTTPIEDYAAVLMELNDALGLVIGTERQIPPNFAATAESGRISEEVLRIMSRSFKDEFGTEMPRALEIFTNGVDSALGSSFENKLKELPYLFDVLVSDIDFSTKSLPFLLAITGSNSLSEFNKAFDASKPATELTVNSFILTVSDILKTLETRGVDAGGDTVRGYAEGIANTYGLGVSEVEDFMNAIIQMAEGKLEIRSPSGVFQRIGADTVLGFNLGFKENLPVVLETATELLDNLSGMFGSDTRTIVDDFTAKFTEMRDTTGELTLEVYEESVNFLDNLKETFDNNVSALVENSVENFNNLRTRVIEQLTLMGSRAKENIQEMVTAISASLSTLLRNNGLDQVVQFIQLFSGAIQGLQMSIRTTFDEVVRYVMSKLQELVNNVSANFNIDAFLQLGQNIVNGFIQGIQNKIGEAANKLAELVNLSALAGQQAAQANSPARLTMPLGEDIADGIIVKFSERMKVFDQIVRDSIHQIGNVSVSGQPVYAPEMVSGLPSAGRSVQNNFGPITVQNSMDVAELEFRIRRIVREEMG